jgi:hypothetical protein
MSTSTGPVRWGPPPLTFELCSSDAALMARAALVFRPWHPHQPGEPTWRWRVEPIVGDQRGEGTVWEVRSNGSLEVSVSDTRERALMLVEFLAVQALCEAPDGPLILHSALVAKDGKGVAIIGYGGAGKSTLACALWQEGWGLLCDDATVVELDQGLARPAPRRVSLRASSRDLFGETLWASILASRSCDQTGEGWLFHPDEVDGRARPDATRLDALIFLARQGSTPRPGRWERLAPAHALLALLPYSHVIRRLDPGEAIRRLTPLAEAVPAYDLGRGALADMVKAIECIIEGTE